MSHVLPPAPAGPAPATPPAEPTDALRQFFSEVSRIQAALRGSRDPLDHRFARPADGGDEALRAALRSLPTLFPRWVDRLEEYDGGRYGPLLGVSDEGSAGATIADAAHASAKARALGTADPMAVGVIIDGERMTSAGEVPIGPDEYDEIIAAAFGRTHCTTNVGVRLNARLHQPLPELRVSDAAADRLAWLDQVFARFHPFLQAPGGAVRPLTVRLVVRPGGDAGEVRELVHALEAGRAAGRLGPAAAHRLSLLVEFTDEIRAPDDVREIERWIGVAAESGVPEVAVDGELVEGARRRLSVQSLLNVLEPAAARALLAEAARRGVRLTYRYQMDPESAARTAWTGLHAARSYGLSAAKYGLLPMSLEEQAHVVRLVTRWTEGWTAIPAFYVDAPLVTGVDCFDDDRCADALTLWMEHMRAAGARVVLVDSPDRVRPRRLVRDEGGADSRGVLTLAQIRSLHEHAGTLGLKVLWSGGITPPHAFELARLGVFGIFTTSSTATRIAVSELFRDDPQLPAENEPTGPGVRRIHALVQAGFLSAALADADPALAGEIERGARALLDAIAAGGGLDGALAALDEALARGWPRHWERPASSPR
ncbi:MAG TPA: hypothetical protein VFR81_22260 [Longimicrobium sp.]|nr:hypothetical protein [Longimicrobium sp.]